MKSNIIQGFKPLDETKTAQEPATAATMGTPITEETLVKEMGEGGDAVVGETTQVTGLELEKEKVTEPEKPPTEKELAAKRKEATMAGIRSGAFTLVGNNVMAIKDTPFFAIQVKLAEYSVKEGARANVVKTPPIPLPLWLQMMDFMWKGFAKINAENQITAWFNKTTGEWRAWPLKQEGIGMSTTTLECEENDKFIQALTAEGFETQAWCFTMHHHCTSSAFQSGIDKNDEENRPGMHVTVGNLNDKKPSLHVRCVARLNAIVNDGIVVKPASVIQWEPLWKEVVDIEGAIPPFLKNVITEAMYKDILETKPENVTSPEEWLKCVEKKSYNTGYAGMGRGTLDEYYEMHTGQRTHLIVNSGKLTTVGQNTTRPHDVGTRVSFLKRTKGNEVRRPQVERFLTGALYAHIDLALPAGKFPDIEKVEASAYITLPLTAILCPIGIEAYDFMNKNPEKESICTKAGDFWKAAIDHEALKREKFGLKDEISPNLKYFMVAAYLVMLHSADVDLANKKSFDSVAKLYDRSLPDWINNTEWVGQAIGSSMLKLSNDKDKFSLKGTELAYIWFGNQLPKLRKLIKPGAFGNVMAGFHDSLIPGWKRNEIISGSDLHTDICKLVMGDTYLTAALLLKMGGIAIMTFGKELLTSADAMSHPMMSKFIPFSNEYTWGHVLLAAAMARPKVAAVMLESIDEALSPVDREKLNDLGNLLEYGALGTHSGTSQDGYVD